MKNHTTEEYYTPYQLKLPLEISVLIAADDPVCTFSEVMNHIDLRKYFAEEGCKMGRPRCDAVKLLKIILFAFMELGYVSLRMLENGKAFTHYSDVHICGNQYGRTEELHICEDCTDCPHRQKCYKGKSDRRIIRLNQELTQFHEEVLHNLECVHGALLRMNRSIQAEGTYGIIKWDRSYKRTFRRGLESVILEFTMISAA